MNNITTFAATIARQLFDAQSAVSKAENSATDALAKAMAAVSVGERVPVEAFAAAGFGEASAKVMASYVNVLHGKGAQFGGAGKVGELLATAMGMAGDLSRRDALLAAARAMRDAAKDAGERKVSAKAATAEVKAAVNGKRAGKGGKGRAASQPKPLGEAASEARAAFGQVKALVDRLAPFGKGKGSAPWKDALAALSEAADALEALAATGEEEADEAE